MQIQDKISDILATKNSTLYSVPPAAMVFEALQIIAREDIGCVLVMDGPALLGVLSEREYARNVALHGRNSRDTSVTEVMFTPPITISPDRRIDEAMRIMTDHRIRHLPVVDRETVAGLISMSDLVKWIMSAQERTIEDLQSYITGQYHPALTHA